MHQLKLTVSSLIHQFFLSLPAEFSKFRVQHYNRQGCVIHDKVSISPNVRIKGKFEMGKGSSIAQKCTISGENAVFFIGENVMIASNVVIVALNHRFEDLNIPMSMQGNDEASVIIEDDVWIASKTTIGKGVKIGKGSIIGSNSFVNKNVLPFSIVGGVPAKLIKYRK